MVTLSRCCGLMCCAVPEIPASAAGPGLRSLLPLLCLLELWWNDRDGLNRRSC